MPGSESDEDQDQRPQCRGCQARYDSRREYNKHILKCSKYASSNATGYSTSFFTQPLETITSGFSKRLKRSRSHESARSHDIPSPPHELASPEARSESDSSEHGSGNIDSFPDQSSMDDVPYPGAAMDIDSDDDLSPSSSPGTPARTGSPGYASIHQRHSSDDSHATHESAGVIRAPWSLTNRTGPHQRVEVDDLPEGPSGTLEEDEIPPQAGPSGLLLRISVQVRTATNKFGVSRVYRRRPTAVPDLNLPPSQLNNPKPPAKKRCRLLDIIWPFPNISALLMGNWRRESGSSNQKSGAEFRKLQEIFASDLFNAKDVADVNFPALEALMARGPSDNDADLWSSDGWRTSSISIEVPYGKKNTKSVRKEKQKEARRRDRIRHRDGIDPEEADVAGSLKFVIPNVHTRSLTSIVVSCATDANAKQFHWHGYEEHWTPPGGRPDERVLTDIYNSPEFLEAEKTLLASPPEPDCDLPRVIFAFMQWSDSTHLAQFGDAKLWPFYFLPGNLSKYTRCQPSAHCACHGAFAPSLGPEFDEFLNQHGIKNTPHLKAHCRRELFQAVWKLLLDKDFLHAYKHGIVITCADGIKRRVYPRFFTYSADYPEKVLIATIRDMGTCPCPRCIVKKDDIRNIGSKLDSKTRDRGARVDDDSRRDKVQRARKLIYEHGYAVNSERVDDLLKPESLVPTVNAFSERLGDYMNFFLLLVVDLMHEFELGVWKAVLTHLIRILNSLKDNEIQIFNERFRQVAPFGRDTIRRFLHNVSELKKLAARDFEDIIQCIIPCLEGLLPNEADEAFILDLLYVMAYWHSLAKLRMHTDSSVKELETVTQAVGNCLRHFADVVSPHYNTYETDKEYAARQRREAGKTSDGSSAHGVGGRKQRGFNLATYKLHAMGDYAPTIRQFGPTDGYSTQLGELEHRRVKKRYAQTNKRNFVSQIVKLDSIETVLQRIKQEMEEVLESFAEEEEEDAPKDDELLKSYRIAKDESKSARIHLKEWLRHNHDPALQGFEKRLKGHLRTRLQGLVDIGDETEYTDHELDDIVINNDLIYTHSTAAFNYTTYDIRREHDTINVNSQRRDIMLRSRETGPRAHPYWYARVVGIYHCNVSRKCDGVSTKRRMDFLFVRWFGEDVDWKGGPAALRLNKIGFVPYGDASGAFGFLDPAEGLRACHICPAFADGKTQDLLDRKSKYREFAEGDWTSFYVMRFADRDMMMRYFGMAVGHMNPDSFPMECGMLRKDVLKDNSTSQWPDLGRIDEEDEEEEDEEEETPEEDSEPGEEEVSESDNESMDYDY